MPDIDLGEFLSETLQANGQKAIDIANGVLLRGGKVLLVRRAAHRKTYADLWAFPGGHVERGESVEQALARELVEEIGLMPTVFRKIDAIAVPDKARLYHLYEVTAWSGGEPRLLGDEHSEMRWFDVAAAGELDGLALSGYRALLRRLAQSPGAISSTVGK